MSSSKRKPVKVFRRYIEKSLKNYSKIKTVYLHKKQSSGMKRSSNAFF